MKVNECSCGCGGKSEGCAEKNMQSEENYMVSGNIQTIKRLIDIISEIDPNELDKIISAGHDWAEDHLASAKDDIEEVADFLMNQLKGEEHKSEVPQMGMSHVHTFESYINEGLIKKYGQKISHEQFANLELGTTILYRGNAYQITDSNGAMIKAKDERGNRVMINYNMFNEYGALIES